MTVGPAVSSLSSSGAAAQAATGHRRHNDFDRQLQSSAGQVAQSAPGTGGSSGGLLSNDLLRQIQSLSAVAAAASSGA